MKGADVIMEALKGLPHLPGIYKMIGEKGILYIGKAKNLNLRVKSYTKLNELSSKNLVMVKSVTKLEYEVVNTEVDALLLESSLVKKLQPPFNILLKDDKSAPYIVISSKHTFPGIFTERNASKSQFKLFGPFGDRVAVKSVVNLICKIFKIRSCADSKFKTVKRPCLEYQIKRCSAPCVNLVTEDRYNKDVAGVIKFLSGNVGSTLLEMKREMKELAEREEFEKASEVRDKIFNLQKIIGTEKIDFKTIPDTDVIAIKELNNKVAIEVFVIRGGLSYGGHIFFPSKTEEETLEDILEFFIVRRYASLEAPKQIVVNVSPSNSKQICEAIFKLHERSVKILLPKKGQYKDLIEFVMPNLIEKLEKKVNSSLKIKENLLRLKDLLNLPNTPKRIEVYDNSHTSGAFFLGAFIVADETGFLPKEYRIFNSKFEDTIKGDDYGMLKEVLKRRFLNEKLLQTKPDLIIIDGGKGQFSAARSVFEELGINIPFICMAKGRDRNAGKEWLYFEDKEFQLPFKDQLLYYLQTLRDEAHRFAITSHRKRREKI